MPVVALCILVVVFTVAVVSKMAQQRNAVYKGARLIEPRQDSSKYVVIDEVINQPAKAIYYTDASANVIDTYELKYTVSPFLTGSALMQAFMENFKEFRVRKLEVTMESTECSPDHPRIDQRIFWIPNHYEFDNDLSTRPTTWTSTLESPHISKVSSSGGRNIIRISYIPQMVYQDEIDEDEDPPNPDNIFQVRGDFRSGWMPTGAPYTTLDLRGPQVVFRRPYILAVPANPVAALYSITVRGIFEFRNAKADV